MDTHQVALSRSLEKLMEKTVYRTHTTVQPSYDTTQRKEHGLSGYHTAIRILCIHLCTNRSLVSDPTGWFSLTHFVVLYMDCVRQLFQDLHHLYLTGLKVLSHDSPRVSMSMLPMPAKALSRCLSPHIPVVDMTTSRWTVEENMEAPLGNDIRENVFSVVPDWSISPLSENGSVIPRQRVSMPIDRGKHLSSEITDHLTMIGTVSPRSTFTTLVSSIATRAKFSVHTDGFRSTTRFKALKKMRKRHNTPKASPVLQFLHEKQQDAWTHKSMVTMVSSPMMWKIGLYGLEHTIPNLCSTKQVEEGACDPLACTFIPKASCPLNRSGFQDRSTPCMVTSTIDRNSQPHFRAFSYQLPTNSTRNPLKAPVLLYQYQTMSSGSTRCSSRQSYDQSVFYCMLDAATRTWIRTTQSNPFGPLLILISRSGTEHL